MQILNAQRTQKHGWRGIALGTKPLPARVQQVNSMTISFLFSLLSTAPQLHPRSRYGENVRIVLPLRSWIFYLITSFPFLCIFV